MVRRSVLLAAIAIALVSMPGTALADPKAEAGRLFEQARALLAEGKTSEACTKLAESMRLAPNGGTLLNLADCYEKNGQTASAYLRFREATERAQAAGQKKAAASAEARMKALEPGLARLTIRLAADSAPGTKVTLDGEPAKLDEALPVDPGSHAIIASADGREPATRAVQVPKTAAVLDIEMPVLRPSASGALPLPEPKPAPPPEPRPEPRAASARSGGGFTALRWAGIGSAGLGAVAVGAGVVFGLSAKSKNDEAAAGCVNDDPSRCTSRSVALTDDAKSAATLSTIFLIAGGAALVGGAVLFFLGKESPQTSAATRFVGDGFLYRF